MSYIKLKKPNNTITIEIDSSDFILSDLENWSLNSKELYIKRYPNKVIITIVHPNEILLEELESRGLIK